MSINELRAQYRSSEGRAKQGFVSPVGEVDEQQLKGMITGCWVEPHRAENMSSMDLRCEFTGSCTISFRPDDMPFC